MSEEKLTVLKMIETGTITAEEGAKLLSSLNPKTNTRNSDFNKNYSTSSNNVNGNFNANNNNTNYNASSNSDSFSRFGAKIDNQYKNLEPHFKKFGIEFIKKSSELTEKAAKGLDELVKTLDSAPTSKTPNRKSTNSNANYAFTKSVDFSEIVFGKENNLECLQSIGSYIIKGINSDKISINVKYATKNENANITIGNEKNCYYVKFNNSDLCNVETTIFLPYASFNKLSINTSVGNLNLSGVNCDSIYLKTANGKIKVNKTDSKNLDIASALGDVEVDESYSENAKIEALLGQVFSMNNDIKNLELLCIEGDITIDQLILEKFKQYNWKAENNNSKINVKLPTSNYMGKHIKACATLGNVNATNKNLMYTLNEPSQKELKTIGYENMDIKFYGDFSSTNGSINII